MPAIIEPSSAAPEPQPAETRHDALTPGSRMEIVLPCGRRIIVGADVDGEALGRVVAVLERR